MSLTPAIYVWAFLYIFRNQSELSYVKKLLADITKRMEKNLLNWNSAQYTVFSQVDKNM